jgi:hypothetical protein
LSLFIIIVIILIWVARLQVKILFGAGNAQEGEDGGDIPKENGREAAAAAGKAITWLLLLIWMSF